MWCGILEKLVINQIGDTNSMLLISTKYVTSAKLLWCSPCEYVLRFHETSGLDLKPRQAELFQLDH